MSKEKGEIEKISHWIKTMPYQYNFQFKQISFSHTTVNVPVQGRERYNITKDPNWLIYFPVLLDYLFLSILLFYAIMNIKYHVSNTDYKHGEAKTFFSFFNVCLCGGKFTLKIKWAGKLSVFGHLSSQCVTPRNTHLAAVWGSSQRRLFRANIGDTITKYTNNRPLSTRIAKKEPKTSLSGEWPFWNEAVIITKQ